MSEIDENLVNKLWNIISDGLNPEVVDVSEKVSDVIWNITTLKEWQILLPAFAKIIGEELFIDLEENISKENFIDFINNVFKNDCYFKNLDYEIFKKIIYDLNSYKSSLENKNLKLSWIIKRFDIDRKSKYQEPKKDGKDSAEYSFCKLYEDIEVDWKTIEKDVFLDIDEFIASMWNYGIRYWLDIVKIEDIIKNKKSDRIIIAKSLDPIPWIDARLLTMINLWMDSELQTKTGGLINLKNYKRVFPQIKSWVKIYQKINKTPWYNWINIYWEEILPLAPKDIVLEDIIEEIDSWVKIVEELWIKFIISEIDGYITPLQWKYNSQKVWEDEKHLMELNIDQIIWKLKITKEIDLGIVWPDTWDISTFWDIKAKWLFKWYSIKSNKLEVTWEVSWDILCKNDININWHVNWWHNSKIISIEWNILIKWNVFLNSHIQALNWLVDLQNIETSTIIWKKIKIKNARKTIFIWEDIEIEWVCSDCIFILTNTLSANTIQLKQNTENSIFIIAPPNFEQEIEKCSKQINEINDKKNKIELLIIKIKESNKQITNNEKIQNYLKIGKKIKEKSPLTKEEIDIYKRDTWFYNQELAKYKSNLENQNKLENEILSINIDLEKLNLDLEKFVELTSKQINPKINIKTNIGSLRVYSLDFKPYKSIQDFSIEDLKILTDMKIFLSQKYFKYVLKDTFSSWSVSLQYK